MGEQQWQCESVNAVGDASFQYVSEAENNRMPA